MGQFHDVYGMRGWQWLFLLEHIPSVLLGVMTFWHLPNSVEEATWLTQDEKQAVKDDLEKDKGEAKGVKHRLRDGLPNICVVMLGGIDFSILLSTYAMRFWMPTFIKNAGTTDISTFGCLTSIPSLAGLIGMLAIGSSSDRMRERHWQINVPFIDGRSGNGSQHFLLPQCDAHRVAVLYSSSDSYCISTCFSLASQRLS